MDFPSSLLSLSFPVHAFRFWCFYRSRRPHNFVLQPENSGRILESFLWFCILYPFQTNSSRYLVATLSAQRHSDSDHASWCEAHRHASGEHDVLYHRGCGRRWRVSRMLLSLRKRARRRQARYEPLRRALQTIRISRARYPGLTCYELSPALPSKRK